MQASMFRAMFLTGSVCLALAGCSMFSNRPSGAAQEPVMQEGSSRASPPGDLQPQGNAPRNAGNPMPLSKPGAPGSGDTNSSIPAR